MDHHYYFIVALVPLSCFILIAQAQERCCYPKQYTQTFKQTVSMGGYIIQQSATYSSDATVKKTAWNATSPGMDMDGKLMNLLVLIDYNKNAVYNADLTNKQCTKAPPHYPMLDCIPERAKFIGSGNIGHNTKVNGWSMPTGSGSGNQMFENVTIFVTDPDCIMVSTTMKYTPQPAWGSGMIAITALDYKPGVGPNVFDVPPFCPPVDDKDSQQEEQKTEL